MRSPNRSPAPSGYLLLAADGCPTLKIPVTTADAASRSFGQYRDRYGVGASDMTTGCGNIIAADGTLVATVSYNGRVWTPDGILLQEPPRSRADQSDARA